MHEDIKNSGLGGMLKIRPMTDNMLLAQYLGKRVRYKPELAANADFVHQHGKVVLSQEFEIKEVQKDHAGQDMLRGYFDGDTFGRVINPDHIDIVHEKNLENTNLSQQRGKEAINTVIKSVIGQEGVTALKALAENDQPDADLEDEIER